MSHLDPLWGPLWEGFVVPMGLGSHLEDFRVPIGCGQVQRRAARVVGGIGIGTQDKQVPHNLRGCSCCCHQQGSLGTSDGVRGA